MIKKNHVKQIALNKIAGKKYILRNEGTA